MEEWRHVKDFPDYMVSNMGRIAKVLNATDFKGYRVLNLYKDNTKKAHRKSVHRLVGEAFLPEPGEAQTTIDHIDRNRDNNLVSNLRWASPLEQMTNKNLRSKYSLIKREKNLFRVYIIRNKVAVFDKRFKTIEEAVVARDAFLAL
jgi:hypothetical protein